MRTRWDIFCAVIDNFGDIGVTWRLARQLAAEYDAQVCLWVDDLDVFCRLCPSVDSQSDKQVHEGVAIHWWREPFALPAPADVVIEAFACELPANYIAAMQAQAKPPLWLNLEYLSAEEWVSGCHKLPSPQANGLQKYFFFPGFSSDTGGLIRERGLLVKRRLFEESDSAKMEFLRGIGVGEPYQNRLVSLFCYDNLSLPSLLAGLSSSTQSTLLLIPDGTIAEKIRQYTKSPNLAVGERFTRGQLSLQLIPFLNQNDYDQLLWCCDLNFVRGEDSFVRAQWAAKPFIWQIYPQQDQAHLGKIAAFLSLYCQGLSPTAVDALTELNYVWNQGQNCGDIWAGLEAAWPELARHAGAWSDQLGERENLAFSLVQFHQNWL
jgi:uncharacterized repeat protein (TIGR03837 family)